MFLIYLGRLYDLLRGDTDRWRFLGSLVLSGGALFVALHAVSDIGIIGALGVKLASFASQHDPGVAYTLYLMTFGLDSAGDVFGSVFAVAAGVLVIDSGVLPRGLGWLSTSSGSCSSCKVSASAASSLRSGSFLISSGSCCS